MKRFVTEISHGTELTFSLTPSFSTCILNEAFLHLTTGFKYPNRNPLKDVGRKKALIHKPRGKRRETNKLGINPAGRSRM